MINQAAHVCAAKVEPAQQLRCCLHAAKPIRSHCMLASELHHGSTTQWTAALGAPSARGE